MPLRLADDLVTVTGVLGVDDVEPLVAWLRAHPEGRVDLSGCEHLHTGALQALLLFRPTLAASPADVFLSTHVLPLLSLPVARPIEALEVRA